MTAIPKYTVLPAQKIPTYCFPDKIDEEYVLKPAYKQIFTGQTIWINDTFYKIWDCKAKYQILKGGAGSGKSAYVARRLLVKALTNKYFRCLYLRKKFSDIKKSCFQLFKDVIDQYGWNDLFTIRESDYEIICNSNGNKLIPAGLDNVDNLKSVEGITDVWIEEAVTRDEKVSDEEFRELIRRVRTSKADLFFYITFNPVDTDNFIYRLFVEKKKYPEYDPENPKKNSFILHTSTYKDNFFLDETYIEEYDMLKDDDYNEWLVYACGEWGNPRTGKEYLHAFVSSMHIKSFDYDPRLETVLVWDFNVNPYISALVFQIKYVDGRKQIRCVDEICLEHPRNDIDESVEEMKDRNYLGFMKNIRWVCDASGKNRVAGFGDSKEVIPYWRLKRMIEKYVSRKSDASHTMKKNPFSIVARSALNRILKGWLPVSYKKSNIDFYVSERCVKTIHECRYIQVDNSSKEGFDKERTTVNGKTVEKMGHTTSCLIYGLHYICPEYFVKKKNLLK